MSNRHLVDQYADIDAEIKRLQAEKDCIREELLRPGANLQGDEYEVRLYPDQVSSRLDRKKFEARYGRAALDGLMSSSEYTKVEVRPRIKKSSTSLQEDIQDEVPF